MELLQWHWWAALAIILFIAEIFLPGFWLLSIGVGAVGASITAGLGLSLEWQLVAFSAFSLTVFFTLRPFLSRKLNDTSGLRTNVDALVGQRGRVTQDFEPGLRLGRVAVGGDDWRAESVDERMMRIGDLIEVVRVESNTLVVRSITQP